LLGRIEWAAIGKQVFSVHLDRIRDECKKRLDSCAKKHIGLADSAENLTTRVFRQAYATIWSVSLVRALEQGLLDAMLAQLRERGLLKARGRPGATHEKPIAGRLPGGR